MNRNKLQNESDIRGVALDGVIGEEVNLTPEVAEMLGKSFVLWLQINTTHTAISVAVGMDSRISG
jgi:phosphomannomutase